MKRKDFFQLLQPLTEKLYRLAYSLIPDDLQAEQLVIDSLNAYLIKEKNSILAARDLDTLTKKDIQVKRRFYFKGIIRYMGEIGLRRAVQLNEQMKLRKTTDFQSFYQLEPKVRLTLSLRYDFQFTAEEIEDITGMPRYEVIEKLHNGRFLLLNDINHGVNA
jgi:DNA-directed RNA polymerase specialized sigma24 family protein